MRANSILTPATPSGSGVSSSSSIPLDMCAWFTAVYAGMGRDHRIETRSFAPGKTTKRSFEPIMRAAALSTLEDGEQYNSYCGMALRGLGASGGKDNCTATRIVWAELDTKHFAGDRAATLQRTQTLGLPLPIIVFTGGGFHVHVPLSELIDLCLPGMKDRVESVNRHLAHALGGDVSPDGVWDVARILRPPCTLNHKYNPPRSVELVRLEPDRRYALEELESWLRQHYPLPQPQPARQPQRRPSVASTPAHARAGFDEGVTPWDEWLAHAPPWQEMLAADGWQLHKTAGDVEYWTRPGKDARDGLSASLGYAAPDVLHVFSSSVKGLEQNGNYNRWAYEVAMRHDGNYAAAARAKAEEGYGTLGRYAKEHHGGDLSAAAKDLAQQKYEAQGEAQRAGHAPRERAMATGGYQAHDRVTGQARWVGGRSDSRQASRPAARYTREVR